MRNHNVRVKRSLVIQSFAPLFLLLAIKYFNVCSYWALVCRFFKEIEIYGFAIVKKSLQHPTFGGLVIFCTSIAWLIATLVIALGFKGIQKSGFKSSGEKIIIVNTESEGSAIFLVTYVLPLLTDDVSSFRGLAIFILMLIMVITLLINSKVFYHNPILVALKYKTYSFKFINPDKDIVEPDVEYVCITRGKGLSVEKTIKRKHISDGVFLIYND